jgi:hypothetical protein
MSRRLSQADPTDHGALPLRQLVAITHSRRYEDAGVTVAEPEVVSMEVLSRAANASIVRLPWRRYPGVVVQGDTLGIMTAAAERVATALDNHPDEDVRRGRRKTP